MSNVPVSADAANANRGLFAKLPQRPRMFFCAALMAVVFLLEPTSIALPTRVLVAWNVATWLYFILVGAMMMRSNEASIRTQAAREDEKKWVLLCVGVGAASAALAAIFAELGSVKALAGLDRVEHVALVTATIVSAWTFIHVLFAVHYAHEYYADAPETEAPGDTRAGLEFPDGADPTYLDFLYYSFVIGCACATADVETISKPMRRTTMVHGVVAFFFNTIILALTINISAGLF